MVEVIIKLIFGGMFLFEILYCSFEKVVLVCLMLIVGYIKVSFFFRVGVYI